MNDELYEWSPQSMLEIYLEHPDDFLKIKETLTRIGIQGKDSNRLYQSCHILHKQSKYYIVHFKEMFILDGKTSSLTYDDIWRRNSIALLLSDWGLLRLGRGVVGETLPLKTIKIISHKDKDQWELCPKYEVGLKK